MVTSTDASESIYVSARFDFEWRLPATWEFVPRNEVALADASFPATRSTDEFARDLTASAKKDGHEVTTAAPVMFPRTENGATGCRHRTAADLDLQEQEAVLRGRIGGTGAPGGVPISTDPGETLNTVILFCNFTNRFGPNTGSNPNAEAVAPGSKPTTVVLRF